MNVEIMNIFLAVGARNKSILPPPVVVLAPHGPGKTVITPEGKSLGQAKEAELDNMHVLVTSHQT